MRTIATIAFLAWSFSATAQDTKGKCISGLADEKYPCKKVDLAFALDLGKSGLFARGGNDIWGWTDAKSGREFALMGLTSKTAFVDITDPKKPIHMGDLKTRTRNSRWRDIKVYKNHAFIVSEAYNHGMQVFDLTRLTKIPLDDVRANGPKIFSTDAVYKAFGNAHNLVLNEESGYAYAVGTSTCDGGLHIINIQDPKTPKFTTCIGRKVFEPPGRNRYHDKHGESYTHDAQCVIYKGPDKRYKGHEICVACNEDSLNVVDVTDKAKPKQISVATYRGVRYTHQGWFSPDQSYFFLGDELDEPRHNIKTRTYIWDFTDLENITLKDHFTHTTNAIDHNMYAKGDYLYQANYDSGLRILNIKDVAKEKVFEAAFFDTEPESNRATFKGTWSVFPYFKSGTVVLSGMNGTLYVVKPLLGGD